MSSFTAAQVEQLILQLDPNEQRKLVRRLGPIIALLQPHDVALKELREARFSKGVRCPHCKSEHVQRWGTLRTNKNAAKQRYMCINCKRTFVDLTDAPPFRSRYEEKWPEFALCMAQGLSVRRAAVRLGVHPTTVFRWRHRVLGIIRDATPPTLHGIVEADETYILISEKGNKHLNRKPRKRGGTSPKRGLSKDRACVLVARDREEHTVSRKACFGQVTTKRLHDLLTNIDFGNATLCTDSAAAYERFCSAHGLNHVSISVKRHVAANSKLFHIQNVNAFHARFKKWVRRFNGISTKYLDNYLAWHLFLDRLSGASDPSTARKLLIAACSSLEKPRPVP